MLFELPEFDALRILVAGDVMLDQYWHGATDRVSPEAPVPVVHVSQQENRVGGAANVALNITRLGGCATLFGLTGDDDAARQLGELLAAARVDCRLRAIANCATVRKLRVVSRHQQLLRMDFEDHFPDLPAGLPVTPIAEQLADCDLLVLSDYAKGALRSARELIAVARALGKPVLADPKGSDFGRYRGASLITPNLAEFEAVAGRSANEAELAARGERLMTDLELTALLITRGEQGMELLELGHPPRHLPTRAREVFDVTGAGDTVVAMLALGLAAGMPLEAATQLANVAAGVVVGKLGTASVTPDELRAALVDQQPARHGVLGEEELVEELAAARARGETLVMTNGCFDLLHLGHVEYLEQAARLGDRLLVAVNTDDTVRRLKGEDRPVNPVASRMAVLAALGCVDWVVPFSEDTPERLICRLRPDFLVKGGDNDPLRIPGGDCVRAEGGEVRVMGYSDGCSTTGIIGRIRETDA